MDAPALTEEALAHFLARHQRVLALTGAGLSTASGIPGYRDKDGVRRGRTPIQGPEFRRSEAVRRRYWARSMVGWPTISAAAPNAGHRAMAELVALSKAKPGSIFYGSPSPEFAFTTELLARESGLEMTGVPYKGSAPALTDLMGGSIQVLLSSAGAAKAQLKDGRVKALAQVGAARSTDFPGVPTTQELGLRNFKVYGWFGLFAPAKTPEATLKRLSAAAVSLGNDPAYRARLAQAGYEALSMDREQSRIAVDEHRAIWKTVAPRVSPKLIN